VLDRVDGLLQRHRATAVVGAVAGKWSDDRAGRLAGQISYAGFLSVFPLLLLLLTVLGIVLHGHQDLQDDIVDSALHQFPVVGADLKSNVRQLATANVWALVVALVWLTYGSLKLSRSAQSMMAVVWGIDRADRPRLRSSVPRALAFLVVLGAGFILGGAAAGLGAFGRLGHLSTWTGLLACLVVNILMYGAGFAVIVRVPEGPWSVWPGAVCGGLGWTALQFGGALLVSHQLRHLSNLYGTFATVLGLIWWMALGAMITVAAAEFNVVHTRHLWPRSFRAAGASRAAGTGPTVSGTARRPDRW
jgi:uncharacterized BrkB/YihY/UPF0761 family membrane protein